VPILVQEISQTTRGWHTCGDQYRGILILSLLTNIFVDGLAASGLRSQLSLVIIFTVVRGVRLPIAQLRKVSVYFNTVEAEVGSVRSRKVPGTIFRVLVVGRKRRLSCQGFKQHTLTMGLGLDASRFIGDVGEVLCYLLLNCKAWATMVGTFVCHFSYCEDDSSDSEATVGGVNERMNLESYKELEEKKSARSQDFEQSQRHSNFRRCPGCLQIYAKPDIISVWPDKSGLWLKLHKVANVACRYKHND
jgi:hypothetical protein